MLKIVLFIFMITFASAVDVDMSCPEDVFVDEEFECSVEVFEGSGIYDLKVEANGDSDSSLKILDGSDWKSGYYYLKEFVEEDASVRLKILGEGEYGLLLKLRQSGNAVQFDVGKILVTSSSGDVSSDTKDNKPNTEVVSEPEEVQGVIVLGGPVAVENNEEWDYVSKDGKILDWLPYAFCLFLIFLIGALMWGR